MKRNILLPLFVSSLLLGSSASAAIVLDDAILINFSFNADTVDGLNWNNITEPNGRPWDSQNETDFSLASDLVRFSDGAGTGVGLLVTYSSFGSGTGGKDNPQNAFSFPITGDIPLIATRRVNYNNPGTVYTFTGLDDTLIYDLSILNSHTGDGTNVGNFAWSINGVDLFVDGDGPDGSGLGEVATLNGITTDGSGQIVLVSSSAGTQHINAIELAAVEVIPEPSTILLSLTGACVVIAVLRRRRK